jgi:hypothetical protein
MAKDSYVENNNFTALLRGCETQSLSIREESILRIFEIEVMGRIFGPTGNEVTGLGAIS